MNKSEMMSLVVNLNKAADACKQAFGDYEDRLPHLESLVASKQNVKAALEIELKEMADKKAQMFDGANEAAAAIQHRAETVLKDAMEMKANAVAMVADAQERLNAVSSREARCKTEESEIAAERALLADRRKKLEDALK